ncbi:hypothetical protein ACFL35_13175 [Candidatus Riflebacteria bacterium]
MGNGFQRWFRLSLSLFFIIPLNLFSLDKVPNFPQINYFNSGAQFRGGIKKYFSDVGLGLTFSQKKDANTHRAVFFVVAKHPQKKKETYRVDVALEYGVKGNNFVIKKTLRNKIKGFKKKDRKEIIPFLCMLSHVIRRNFRREKKTEVWSIGKISYEVRIRPKRIQNRPGFEVEMDKINGAIKVKFFLTVKPEGRGNLIWKFRMKSGKIATTFETSTFDALAKLYKNQEWFSQFF